MKTATKATAVDQVGSRTARTSVLALGQVCPGRAHVQAPARRPRRGAGTRPSPGPAGRRSSRTPATRVLAPAESAIHVNARRVPPRACSSRHQTCAGTTSRTTSAIDVVVAGAAIAEDTGGEHRDDASGSRPDGASGPAGRAPGRAVRGAARRAPPHPLATGPAPATSSTPAATTGRRSQEHQERAPARARVRHGSRAIARWPASDRATRPVVVSTRRGVRTSGPRVSAVPARPRGPG